MKQCLIVCTLFILLSCHQHKSGINPHGAGKAMVTFQPLGKFSNDKLKFLKDSLFVFYPIIISIAKPIQPPTNAWYQPRKRWVADSIIEWLRKPLPDSIRLTVGLIEDDISTEKGTIKNYGIMGLGFCPGKSCVVSSFRLHKNTKDQQHFQQRLFKVVAHEMGHNFGLPHCPNQSCIMVDAEGKMKLDGEKSLCSKCKQKLKI